MASPSPSPSPSTSSSTSPPTYFSPEQSSEDQQLPPPMTTSICKHLFTSPKKCPVVSSGIDSNSMNIKQSKATTAASESGNNKATPMQIYLRVRPFTPLEIKRGMNGTTSDGDDISCLNIHSDCQIVEMCAPEGSHVFKNSKMSKMSMKTHFQFTHVLGPDSTQNETFQKTTLPVVSEFLHGRNGLIFTYGITNAGKTFTMEGNNEDPGLLPRAMDVIFNSVAGRLSMEIRWKPNCYDEVIVLSGDEESDEIAIKLDVMYGRNSPVPMNVEPPLANKCIVETDGEVVLPIIDTTVERDVHDDDSEVANDVAHNDSEVISRTDSRSVSPNDFVYPKRTYDETRIEFEESCTELSIWVSYYEVYNDFPYDLLVPIPPKDKRRPVLKLAEDKGNVFIKGLRLVSVANTDEAFAVLRAGQRNRQVAVTQLNQNSSRSHGIFTVTMIRQSVKSNSEVSFETNHITFVDLAGSERTKRTDNAGTRLKEASSINNSLSVLGRCMEALRYNQRSATRSVLVPFRDSKLTRIFQNFFIGKGTALMVVNVNQLISDFDETCRVMRFASIASKVLMTKRDPPVKAPQAAIAGSKKLTQRTTKRLLRVESSTEVPAMDEYNLLEMDELLDAYGALRKDNDHLRHQLVAAREQLLSQESLIREEVASEMASQLAEMEENYRTALSNEENLQEDRKDRLLNIYAAPSSLYAQSNTVLNYSAHASATESTSSTISEMEQRHQKDCENYEARIERLIENISKLKEEKLAVESEWQERLESESSRWAADTEQRRINAAELNKRNFRLQEELKSSKLTKTSSVSSVTSVKKSDENRPAWMKKIKTTFKRKHGDTISSDVDSVKENSLVKATSPSRRITRSKMALDEKNLGKKDIEPASKRSRYTGKVDKNEPKLRLRSRNQK